MKSPYEIIVRPHITERTVALAYGDPKIKQDELIVRKYTFIVADEANKHEIKDAVEAIYNSGKKAADAISVAKVHIGRKMPKLKRRGQRTGYTREEKKAIVTLQKGQALEDYGI